MAQPADRLACAGLSIVSPAWLLRSLSLGTPQRCMHLSMDASKHLPTPGPAVNPSGHDSTCKTDLACDLTNRQARCNLVQQLHGMQSRCQEGESPEQAAMARTYLQRRQHIPACQPFLPCTSTNTLCCQVRGCRESTACQHANATGHAASFDLGKARLQPRNSFSPLCHMLSLHMD